MLDWVTSDYEDQSCINLWHLRWFHQAVKRTVSQAVYDCLEFNQFVRRASRLDNIKWWDEHNIWKPHQAIFQDFREDLWNVWQSFPPEVARDIIIKINERRILWQTDDWFQVVLNQNSYEFYRDTNFSLSLNSTEYWKEVCIVWFKILPWRKIEIFQIQWKWKYWITTKHFWALLDWTCKFLKDLWFEKAMVVRWDKLFYSRTPIIIPNWVSSVSDFVERNKEMIVLTYNVNTIRKWWFKKVSNDNDKKWYSAERILL